MTEPVIKEKEADLEKVKDAMNLISREIDKAGIDSVNAGIGMAILLRYSGQAEFFAFMAAELAESFSETVPTAPSTETKQ